MKLIVITVFVGLVYSVFSNNVKDYVIELTESNFNNYFKDNSTNIFVAFYANWCKHCHALLPELSKVSLLLNEQKSNIKIAKIDCHKNKKPCITKPHNITNYPTIKYYKAGVFHDFKASRAAQDIYMWLATHGREKNKYFSTPEEVEEYVKEFALTTVYFGSNYTENYRSFQRNTQSNTESAFGYCDTDACLRHFGVDDGQMIIFKPNSELDFEKKYTIPKHEVYAHEHDVVRLIDIYSAPLVQEFGYKTSKIAYIHKVNMLYMFCKTNDPNRSTYIKAMQKAAENYRGKYQFVISDIVQEHEQRLTKMVGVKSRDLPSLVLHDRAEKKYKLSEGLDNPLTYTNFIQEYEDGKLKNYLKTQDPFPNQDKLPVKNIVASEFKEFIKKHNSNGDDVCVIFYADFNEESQNFLKFYPNIANKYRNNGVIFAQMDYRANEMEELFTRQYPVINLYLVNGEIKKYNGDPSNEKQVTNYLSVISTGKLKSKKKDL